MWKLGASAILATVGKRVGETKGARSLAVCLKELRGLEGERNRLVLL